MANQSLKYSLSMDREEFDAAIRLVKAVLLTTNLKGPFNVLTKATEDPADLTQDDRDFIAQWATDGEGELEGLCCWKGGGKHEFNIWLSADMDPLSDIYRVTLLHELVHGYMNYSSHDAKFRDLLGRVFYHYCDIVSPLASPGFLTIALNYRYARRKANEDENKYMRRLIADKEKTQSKAEAEYSAVAEMYERIS